MKSVTTSFAGLTALLTTTGAFAHPGHSSQLVHSHDGMMLGLIGVSVLGVALTAGIMLAVMRRKSTADPAIRPASADRQKDQ